jgi:hypothetical protein
MCIFPCPTCPQSYFEKKMSFYMTYVKMTKFDTKISLSQHFLSFCTTHKFVSIFHKTLREHIEYEDVHANSFFELFRKWLKGAYAHGIKTAFHFPCDVVFFTCVF